MPIYTYLDGHKSEMINVFLVIKIYLLTVRAHITTDILRKFNWSKNRELGISWIWNVSVDTKTLM